MFFVSLIEPNIGLAEAKTPTQQLSIVVIPALFIDIVYYSIASCIETLSYDLILSNSSIHTIPPSAITNAPPSN